MDVLQDWLSVRGVAPVLQYLVVFPLFALFAGWSLAHIARTVISERAQESGRRVRARRFVRRLAWVGGVGAAATLWWDGYRDALAALLTASPRDAERLRILVEGVLSALTTTVVLLLLLLFLRRGAKALRWRLKRWEQAGGPLRLRGLELVSRDRIAHASLGAARIGLGFVGLLLIYLYVPLVLTFFPGTDDIGDRYLAYAIGPARETAAALLSYVPNLFHLVVIGLATLLFLRALRFFRDAVSRGTLKFEGFDREWADPTYRIARAITLIFALMSAYPHLPGAGSAFFQGFSLFLGAVITLGSSSAVGNAISGLVLSYTRAFRIGDSVRIGEAEGMVIERSMIVTRIRTIRNEEVTVPNSEVLRGHVVNFTNASARGELILVTNVALGYDVPWRQAHALLADAASRTAGVRGKPRPFVRTKNLGNFAVTYELHAFTDRADHRAAILAELRRNALDACQDAGVEVLTPDVHAVRTAPRCSPKGSG